MNSYCSLLWLHSASKTTGEHRACCLMSNHKTGGIARKPNGDAYNWKTDDIMEAHNSPAIRDMRLKMLRGETVPECQTCYTKEDSGYSSRRQSSNKRYHKFTIERASELTDSNGYTTQRPRFLDMRFGNLCNLKCVMCHSNSSNQWYDDHVRLFGQDDWVKNNLLFTGKKWIDKGQMDWWQSESFWQQMDEFKSELRHLQMVGGEPLMIEKHYDFLQQLVDTGDAQHIKLEYDTNLTNVQPRAIELWKEFRSVNIRVSVDDYGEQNRYIRYPSNYEKIIENILLVQELETVKLDIAITWQVMNAYTVLNLLDDIQRLQINANLNMRILSQPAWYDVKILPTDSIVEIYENSQHKDKVQHLINYMKDNPDVDKQQIDKFISQSNKLDQIRNLDWRSTFPQLAELLNE